MTELERRELAANEAQALLDQAPIHQLIKIGGKELGLILKKTGLAGVKFTAFAFVTDKYTKKKTTNEMRFDWNQSPEDARDWILDQMAMANLEEMG